VTQRSAAFCERLGIEVPIVQAPVGTISTPGLAAAVSNAGGLGMIGVGGMPLDRVEARLRATAELTGRPFGANVIVAISPPEAVDVVLDAGVKILSLFWGDTAPFVARAHQAGALVLTTVGTAREAREAVATGEPEAMAVYAGQGVGLITRVEPAAEIIRRLIREAQQALTG